MQEIRMDDLRFDERTTSSYLQKAQIKLTDKDIKILAEKTEGWAAGLQLATLSLQRSSDTTSFVNSFRGNDRFVLDYLTDEVLKSLPENVYNFLLKTSVLERFCAPLCDVLTEEANASEMLGELDAANLFLIPLDNERQWYRYHHLFADLLRQRLCQTVSTQELASLNRCAASWYEQNTFYNEAVSHYLVAEAFEQVIRLLHKLGTNMMNRGEFTTFVTWANALPEEMVLADTELVILYVSLCLINGPVFCAINGPIENCHTMCLWKHLYF